jgi:surface polysaccharide O-acyltransferase-like enzyme
MTQKHISGFNYLRAVFAILIVVWHAQSVSFLAKSQPGLKPLIDIFYYNICLLAVPIFFQIALFLFYRKQLSDSTYFLKKRLPDLVFLYSGWMAIGVAVNSILTQGNYLVDVFNRRDFSVFVVGSRSELFFLFGLILLTAIAFINLRFFVHSKNSLYVQLIFLSCSLILVVLFDFLMLLTRESTFVVHWNPICFIPYVFSSAILVLVCQEQQAVFRLLNDRKRFLFLLGMLFGGASWLEWQTLYLPDFLGASLPAYMRISLVFGSFMICYGATFWVTQPPRLIQAIAQESLGIYLIHMYLLQLLGVIRSSYPLLNALLNPLIEMMLVVMGSILLSKLFKQNPIGRAMLHANSKGLVVK